MSKFLSEINITKYTRNEELANTITHGIGAILSVIGLFLLVNYAAQHGDAYHITSVTIFGATLILLYGMSTLYHWFEHPDLKRIFRILDHSCIYLLIAGSYTPFTLVTMRGPWGWTMLAVIWTLAIAGVIFKLFYTGHFDLISTGLYIGMGWIAVFSLKPLLESTPIGGLILLVVGGVLYTGGTAFYLWEKLPYNHAVWHGFVMGGSFCHFMAVYYYVLP
jgi:hemolysin III